MIANSLIFNLRQKAFRHKTIIQNFSYLSALQIFNMLLPLATYPYLIRILGAELFGTVIFAQSVITYFSLIINFGFNISATKEISIHRSSISKLSEIVSSVLIIKLFLWILSLTLLLLFIGFIYKGEVNKLLFLFAFGLCFNELLFSIWFFQGIEKMKYITFINLISRSTFVLLIFLIVKKDTDFLYVPLLNGIGVFIGGMISLYIIFKKKNITFKIQSYKKLLYYFKESLPLFWTRVAAQLYTNTTTVIIGIFLSKADVAYFDLAVKISALVRLPVTIFSQTIFPKSSKEKNLSFIKRMLKYCLMAMMVVIAGVTLFVKYPILLIGSTEMLPSITITRILLFGIIPIIFSTFYGTHILVSFNFSRLLSKSMLITSLFYLSMLFIMYLLDSISLINIALLVVINETFLAGFQYISYKKLKLAQ